MFIDKGCFCSLRRFLLTRDGWIGAVTGTTDEVVDSATHVPQRELTNKAFQLDFISLDGRVQIPVCHIFVRGINGAAIYCHRRSSAAGIESGFRVLGCVCDGEAAIKTV